jgi:hypothetical protein
MTPSEAQALASNGINWVRSDVSINDSETNWHTIYQLAKEYNLSLIGTLLPYTLNFNNSSSLQDWNVTVKMAVAEFGDVVKVWEIWNEPINLDSSLGNLFSYGNATQYFDLMKAAYQIIKGNNSNAIVLGLGGLPLYSGGNNTYLNQGLDFAQQIANMENKTGMKYCDAISLHAYPYGHYADQTAGSNYTNSLSQYQAITGKDVWITETGQESGTNNFNSSEREQSDYLNISFSLFKSQNVKAYIWYELNDNNTGNNSDDKDIQLLVFTILLSIQRILH